MNIKVCFAVKVVREFGSNRYVLVLRGPHPMARRVLRLSTHTHARTHGFGTEAICGGDAQGDVCCRILRYNPKQSTVKI